MRSLVFLMMLGACGSAPPPTRTEGRSSERPHRLIGLDLEQRAALQARSREGIVIVAWNAGEPRVLGDCGIEGRYAYVALPVKVERVVLPEITLETTEVGLDEANKARVARRELVGRCDGATHFIRRIHLGAFEVLARESRPGHDAQYQERDGDPAACGAGPQRSPRCSAPLSAELVSIEE